MPRATPNVRSQSKRERFRQQVLARDGAICRMPVCLEHTRTIDLRLKSPHSGSYSADHIRTVAELGDAGAPVAAYFDPDNGRASHLGCNRTAGARLGGNRLAARRRMGRRSTTPRPPTTPPATTLKTSRTW